MITNLDLIPIEDRAIELGVARAFIAMAGTLGSIPAKKPYSKYRDIEFFETFKWSSDREYYPPLSSCKRKDHPGEHLQDARIGIFYGRKFGYSDQDIAAFLYRNYAIDDLPWRRDLHESPISLSKNS